MKLLYNIITKPNNIQIIKINKNKKKQIFLTKTKTSIMQ